MVQSGWRGRLDLELEATVRVTSAAVAGDVVQIGTSTWAVHGTIPVDGEVLLAGYASRDRATAALTGLTPVGPPPGEGPGGGATSGWLDRGSGDLPPTGGPR